MKLFKVLIVMLITLVIVQETFGQFKMVVKNGYITGRNFNFDVYLESTGANFNLTSWQIIFNFNPAILNGGNATFNYVDGSSELVTLTPYNTQYILDNVTPNLASASFIGSDVITTTPVKVGTYKLTNSVDFASLPMMIDFDFIGTQTCEMNIDDVSFIVPQNYFNYLAPYKLTLVNDIQVSTTEYEFDVMLENTTSSFMLSSYALVFKYNQNIANGGTLSFSYIANSTTLPAVKPIGLTANVVTDGTVLNLVCGSEAGNLNINTIYKVGRFRISNTVPFGTASGNLDWDFIGAHQSQFNIKSTNFTVQSNYINNLSNVPLPVEIVTFTAKEVDKKVKLNWVTATEEKNFGFDVERKSDNGSWEKIGFLQGAGNSNSLKEYHFTDAQVNGTQLQYRLKQIDTDGKTHYTNSVEVKLLPTAFGLTQNYPNPFNPETTIKYQLPVDSKIKLVVYNMIGEEVASLIKGVVPAGYHSVNFNAVGLSSGNYIYRLETPDFVQVKKMIVLK
ncbi:MAG: T9SS type A sorting domain-containing protein [Syntrophothermus sp.]